MTINEYIAGAVAGMSGVVIGHPFDTTKLQMQIRTTGDHKLTRVRDAFASVAAQGLKNGLFRGMMFPVVSYGLVNSMFFGVYGNTIRLLEPDHTVRPTNSQVYLAGCVAGTSQLLVACPVEVIKCTLQAQIPLTMPKSRIDSPLYSKIVKPRTYYKGPIEASRRIFGNEGVLGFYKGMFVMFMRDVPSYGLYLLSYETLHKYLFHHGLTDKKGVIAAIIAGGLAGCASWLGIMPFDVIKSRLQVDHGGRYKGFWDCAYLSVKRGGFAVLFTGTSITILRAFPVNAVTFLVYSQMIRELNLINPHPSVEKAAQTASG
ncbi:unnamed protein product [Candidula unifasciata]|uniref:Uncharacterized protein n=1 Tax=Candidula unifasciata TaxID=100452 RepID=A0A8S4A559_9EUPU|nr:unnamed protein product [Candidula unifasciata]